MNWTSLLIALGLLIANGFFVGAEFALIAARRSRLEQLEAEGNARAKVAIRSVREVSLMLAGAQLGITMASLGLGAIAEPAVAHGIEAGLEGFVEIPSGVLHTISFVIGLSIVVFLHMVIGEMAPKNIAIAKPEETALWFAIPFRAFCAVLRPFIWFLNWLANGVVRLLGVEPRDEVSQVHTTGEIGLMIEESARGGLIDPFEKHLLSGAIGFSERDAASVMVPRTELVARPLDVTPAELEKLVVETGHSRVPLYRDDLDNVVGFFHAKDLLRVGNGDWDRPLAAPLIRRMLVVPESLKLHPLLLEMRRRRQHVALVIEEHGGTAGMVTLEDLLEELVGDIRDEYDASERGVIQLSPHRFVVPGTLRIDEAERITGLDLPEGEYETIAGFIMDRLGRIPKRRDVVEHEGWIVRVLAMRRRRVEQVLVERVSQEGSSSRANR